MKNTYHLFVMLLVLGSLNVKAAGAKGLAGDYSVAKDKLAEAVGNRNFKAAKMLLTDLMPIIKENIKETKKEAHTRKTEEGFDLAKLHDALDRKKEIYSTLHHLVNVSPAALRVKSAEVISLIEEFEQLDA